MFLLTSVQADVDTHVSSLHTIVLEGLPRWLIGMVGSLLVLVLVCVRMVSVEVCVHIDKVYRSNNDNTTSTIWNS